MDIFAVIYTLDVVVQIIGVYSNETGPGLIRFSFIRI